MVAVQNVGVERTGKIESEANGEFRLNAAT